MLLKIKMDKVTIKGRGFACGINQRNWISKEDKFSLTMSTEGLMLSFMIDGMEGRDVATADISGAFLKNITAKETYTSRRKGQW